MTQDQIREVVKITIDELTKRSLIKTNDYQAVLQKIEPLLFRLDENTKHLLNQLSDDSYIDIIYLHYRERKTLEWIAEYYGVEVSTIKRNKKRLIYKINELMEG